MNLVELEAFFPDIEPELPRCPVPVIENRIRDAIIDACERANIWRWSHPEILLIEGERNYDLATPTADTLVHSVLHVLKDGRPLEGCDTVNRHEPYSTPGMGFSIGERGTIQLASVPKTSTPPVPTLIDITTVDSTLPDVLDEPVDPGPVNTNEYRFVYDVTSVIRNSNQSTWSATRDVFSGTALAGEFYQAGDLALFRASTPLAVGSFEFVKMAGDASDGSASTELQYSETFNDQVLLADPRWPTAAPFHFQARRDSNNDFWLMENDEDFDLPLGSQSDIDAYQAELALYNASVVARQTRIDELAAINQFIANYPTLLENRVKGLELLLSIKPSRTTLYVDEVLRRDYHDLIVLGSLARALAMRGRPWSDPNLAKDYKNQYEFALAKARQGIDRGFKTGSQRFKPRKFT